MTTEFAVNDVCCVALELSKSTWVCAFAPPESGRASVHRMRAGDVDRLISVLEAGRARAMRDRSRSLDIALCYEIGYDGFRLARLLIARGIRTIVFDPASFLKPRRGRPAKTDRLDAEEMTRILRTWLSGDRAVATAVRIPTVEEEDAKRIERERKNLVEERTRIVGRIKGLLALHGIWLSSKRIGKGLLGRLDTMMTGDGRLLPPFLRRDIGRMIRHYEFICDQIAEVEADRKTALNDEMSSFPYRDKIRRLTTLGAVGVTTATVLVAEVFHRWSAYDGKHIRLQQSKTHRRVVIPAGEPLRLALDAAARRTPIILTNRYGRPWTSDGFRTSWAKTCRKAGIRGLTFHDLRGSAVVRLAIADATVPQIAAFTGHSLKDVEAILDAHYLGRDVKLAEIAIMKLETRTKL